MPTIDVIIPAKNVGDVLRSTVRGWLEQELPHGWSSVVHLIDDGSDDGVPAELAETFKGRLSYIRHDFSKGRAQACNSGALSSRGEFLAFFDGDCLPADRYVLAAHIEQITLGATIVFGCVTAEGEAFGARYFEEVARARVARFGAGQFYAFSTQNCICSRELFLAAGMFDPEYRHYGFEDRDLVICILNNGGTAAYAERATVFHSDKFDLNVVARKLNDAGRYTSNIFSRKHPDTYRAMPYSKIDLRCYRFSSLPSVLFRCVLNKPVLNLVAAAGAQAVAWPIPYVVKRTIVKFVSAYAYLVGTAYALTDRRSGGRGEN